MNVDDRSMPLTSLSPGFYRERRQVSTRKFARARSADDSEESFLRVCRARVSEKRERAGAQDMPRVQYVQRLREFYTVVALSGLIAIYCCIIDVACCRCLERIKVPGVLWARLRRYRIDVCFCDFE